MITSAASASSATTTSRIRPLRWRMLTSRLPRREDDQQAAVVVVRGKDVSLRRLRPVALRMDHHGLVEHADAPLERRADVVVAVLKVEPEHLLHRAADHVGVAEAGELAGAAAGADQAALLGGDEEGGVGRWVVVVEQLEQEAVATVRAAARAVAKPGGAVDGDAAVPAVGADEVRHEGFSRLGRRG